MRKLELVAVTTWRHPEQKRGSGQVGRPEMRRGFLLITCVAGPIV
jgi:hypothetical protein